MRNPSQEPHSNDSTQSTLPAGGQVNGAATAPGEKPGAGPTDEVSANRDGSNYVTKGQKTANNKGITPYQVIKSLPATATEAQKDSAIQANFKPGKIEYNTRVDTLTTFGLKVVKLPKMSELHFRDEGYFKGNRYFHPEMGVSRNGVLGDPAPYTLSGDDTITGLLLGCFILALISLSGSLNFIMRQTRNFFYMPRSAASLTETTGEVRFQFFLVMQTSLLLSIVYYLYTRTYTTADYVLDSQLLIIGIFFGIITGYFILKGIIYNMVNWVFFPKEKNRQWNKTILFLSSIEGVALFPIVMLQVYFRTDMSTTLIYALIVAIITKILTFYKCYAIFFRKTGVFLQIFLYFCALELVPVTALFGTLVITGNYLTINI